MVEPTVRPSYYEPNIHLQCSCGWEGIDEDIEKWDIQHDRDRVVRRCPSCQNTVPEWGTLSPISGAAEIARGPLREDLVESGVITGK